MTALFTYTCAVFADWINVWIFSSFPWWRRSTILLPTMTPSQYAVSSRTCSGEETPKPANTGLSVCCLMFVKWLPNWSPNLFCTPVMPLIVTAYKNPSVCSAILAKRSGVLVSVANRIKAISCSFSAFETRSDSSKEHPEQSHHPRHSPHNLRQIV